MGKTIMRAMRAEAFSGYKDLKLVDIPKPATRNQLLARLARENALIATPHASLFPALGRLRKDGHGYRWVSVVFTDQWDER